MKNLNNLFPDITKYSDDYQLTDLTVGKVVNLKLSASFDTYLQLINAAIGEEIVYDDDAGPGNDSLITFIPQVDINYIARVTSFSKEKTGTYSLNAVQIPEVNLNNSENKFEYKGKLNEIIDGDTSQRLGKYSDDLLLTEFIPNQPV